jgi:hypothetical protein
MDLVQADVVHIHISPEDKMPLYLEHRYVVCFPPFKCKSSVLSFVTVMLNYLDLIARHLVNSITVVWTW